mgnify:CR=1 FL=1
MDISHSRTGYVPTGKSLKRFRNKHRPRVLLVQGPVGTFYNHLQSSLETLGYETWVVNLNAGDALFGKRFQHFNFMGGLEKWEARLSVSLARRDFDAIVIFGSERPAHRVVRDVADYYDVPVLSLEEGYLRPGLITAEWGGNNANSPLAGNAPDELFVPEHMPEAKVFRSFGSMGTTAMFYFAVSNLFTFGRRRELFHRPMSLPKEWFCWVRNGYRRLAWQHRNFNIIQNLLEHYDRRFFLVPLQVAADSNMQEAAMGWNTMRLIEESMQSFAESAPADTRLVFKVHPLERGHQRYAPIIEELAERLGIHNRVDVIDVGSMGLLARHSAGMITINSTSGLSAIHHGRPLLVLGKAVYASPQVAICAMGVPDFAAFWQGGFVATQVVRRRFLDWIRHEALLPGDFYSRMGKRVASEAVARRIDEKLAPLWRQQSDSSVRQVEIVPRVVVAKPCVSGSTHVA